MEGDTIGLLIVADEQESVRSLAEKLRDAASLRVDGSGYMEVVYQGIVLDPDSTLAQADFKPLRRFDLRRNHGLSESRNSR
jgi:hypothetical protein